VANFEALRRGLVNWYQWRADDKLRQKAVRYTRQIGVNSRSLGIRHFDARWASCSAKGEILFNWRIIMAPNRIGDYVVVHELCHLLHHDHGEAFWRAVGQVLPDYGERREWLKQHGATLAL
jgi:predicted metal-dependent hydrolase